MTISLSPSKWTAAERKVDAEFGVQRFHQESPSFPNSARDPNPPRVMCIMTTTHPQLGGTQMLLGAVCIPSASQTFALGSKDHAGKGNVGADFTPHLRVQALLGICVT